MVDCQIHLIRVRLGIVGEQSHRGDVRGYHFFRHEVRRSAVRGKIGGGILRQSGIGQQVSGLAYGPQRGAQPCGAANGIAVGPDMGQDQDAVKGAQQRGGLRNGQHPLFLLR